MYPLEIQLAQTLAAGKPVAGVTWDVVEADLIALLRRTDRGGTAGLVVPAEYLETVIIK